MSFLGIPKSSRPSQRATSKRARSFLGISEAGDADNQAAPAADFDGPGAYLSCPTPGCGWRPSADNHPRRLQQARVHWRYCVGEPPPAQAPRGSYGGGNKTCAGAAARAARRLAWQRYQEWYDQVPTRFQLMICKTSEEASSTTWRSNQFCTLYACSRCGKQKPVHRLKATPCSKREPGGATMIQLMDCLIGPEERKRRKVFTDANALRHRQKYREQYKQKQALRMQDPEFKAKVQERELRSRRRVRARKREALRRAGLPLPATRPWALRSMRRPAAASSS